MNYRVIPNSEKDRNMGKASRFIIDGVDRNNLRYKMRGIKINQTPDSIYFVNVEMLASACQ